MTDPYYKTPEQGSISLQGKISKVNTVSGRKGAPIRVEVLFPDEGNNSKMLDDMRGTGIDVRVVGPILVASDTEHPDQTQFDDPPQEED